MIEGRPPDPVRHACLRDLGSWAGVELERLEVLPGGRIALERVPGVAPGMEHEPGRAAPSGIAVDDRCGLYLSDSEGGRIVRRALDCGDELVLSTEGVMGAPAGLCVGPGGWVFVCDRAAGAIVVLTADLRIRDVWSQGLREPVAVAADGRGRIVVAEAAGGLRRFDRHGRLDDELASSPAGSAGPVRALALAPDGAIFAATDAGVQTFDGSGAAGRRLLPGTAVGPVALCDGVLLAADVQTGLVRRLRVADGRDLAPLAGWRGRLAGLACARGGRVYLKPGAGASCATAEPDAARARSGELVAGPLDAGEDNVWRRVAAEVDVPTGSSVLLETASADDPASVPEWTRGGAPDTLVAPGRFLWVRVTLERDDATGSSPELLQVHARTPGGSYFEHLPAVYARENPASGVLDRFLALAQAQLDDVEAAIESLPSLADPQRAPVEALPALAEWQAFELPLSAAVPEGAELARRLIAELPELRSRRGTASGVAELVELYAGVRPALFECFRERRTWVLGVTSALGFDTRVLGAAVDGLLLGETLIGQGGPEDPDAWGEALFADTAHLFTVVIPEVPERREAGVRAVLEAEKPAHTDFHLCVAAGRLTVGIQAHVGLDALVADEGTRAVASEGARLDVDARTAPARADAAGVVGERDRLGLQTVIG